MPSRISYAQNAEDVRVWRALHALAEAGTPLTYIDVGANFPWELSITASLYRDGWRGLLIEADPELAQELRRARPRDRVVHAAAAETDTSLTFHRVPGTGLGTVDAQEAKQAAARGFSVEQITVAAQPLSKMWESEIGGDAEVHFLSIDVEGAEGKVIAGWDRSRHRPWIVCIEAVEPGTRRPDHDAWESALIDSAYYFVAFDGVNRWYVAAEHADRTVSEGYTLAESVAIPLNALDIGVDGWVTSHEQDLRNRASRSTQRSAWQRELARSARTASVPVAEYERQITELRDEVLSLRGSRAYRLSREMIKPVSRLKHEVRKWKDRAPGPIAKPLLQRRVLRHVTANMHHLIDPAYLGSTEDPTPSWSSDIAVPPPKIPPNELQRTTTTADLEWARQWLALGPWDTDRLLETRMDNHGDEVGRTQAALRTRLALAKGATNRPSAASEGDRVLIDVRSLQSRAFGGRGIGRFARTALEGALQAVPADRVDLLIDPSLEPLPHQWGDKYRSVEFIAPDQAGEYSLCLQLSPMTHSPEPLAAVITSNAHCLAVVFDFIPLHYPSVYLASVPNHCEYAARLDALRLYDEFVCISDTTRSELTELLGDPAAPMTVAWPRDVGVEEDEPAPARKVGGRIIVMTGDEPRKNTFTALAGIAAATTDETFRDVQVIGMAGQSDRVHHWSIAAMMRPGEATTLGRVSDSELTQALANASLVLVPSFDEGLSLPVIEALAAGTPVVASDIPAHRELLGTGTFLADPRSPASFANAITKHRGSFTTCKQQYVHLRKHRHLELSETIRERVTAASPGKQATREQAKENEHASRASGHLRIALVTPWAPQATGVGDFSTVIGIELARHVDLTVITTSDADVPASLVDVNDPPSVTTLPLSSVLDNPQQLARFDRVIAVIGNSHFHLPILELTRLWPCTVIAHDTRMNEFYLAADGRGPTEQLMLRSADSTSPANIDPVLEEQIADMRLLQNAAMWEVAHRAHPLILHSQSAAPLIERQTGIRPRLLPFANYRAPEFVPDAQERAQARARLGLSPEAVHLATFGYVDLRTKLTDVVLEAAGWLTRWGHAVHLHVVGQASQADTESLQARAQDWGLDGFTVTGFTSDADFRDYLLAVDLGIQLRVSPFLGVSGPLSDLAAYGTRGMGSEGLCIDVDAPAFISRLPQAVSPTMLATAIEEVLQTPRDELLIEQQRRDYLASKTAQAYVQQLLDLLREEAP